MRRILTQGVSPLLLLVAVVCGWAAPVRAERPETVELLPDQTLVYVRIPSIPNLIDRFQQTSGGRMFDDPQVRPLIEGLYGSASEEFQPLEEYVGLSLDELMQLPQGEVCFAMVAPEDGPLSVVFFVDVGDGIENARVLLDHGEQFARGQGASEESEGVGDTDLKILSGGEDDETVAYFVRDETICLTNNPDVARNILARWDGTSEEKRLFVDNRKFITIMNRCKTVDDETPQLLFYVDPIELVRFQAQQSLAGRAGFAFIPTLGLDGLLGIGGTITMATQNYDDVTHLHVLIANPREGIMSMLAMTPGDTSPEAWVPRDVANYMTVNWDIEKTFSTFEELFDSFNGEGAMADAIDENINDSLGVDFREDIIAAFEGRATYAQWYEPPARINSQTNLLGLKLNDASEFEKTIEDILAKVDPTGNVQDASYRSTTYYRTPSPADRRRRFQEQQGRDFEAQEPPISIREPQPAFGVVGDYFLISDSEECIKAAIDASREPELSLQDDPEFQFIEDEVRKLAGTNFPGGVMYARPEESLKMMLEVANANDTRDFIDQMSEENRFFEIVGGALNDNPLPDMETLQQYLAPGGGLMTNDETGLHITFFTLRRE